jgi:hypothetical protein
MSMPRDEGFAEICGWELYPLRAPLQVSHSVPRPCILAVPLLCSTCLHMWRCSRFVEDVIQLCRHSHFDAPVCSTALPNEPEQGPGP